MCDWISAFKHTTLSTTLSSSRWRCTLVWCCLINTLSHPPKRGTRAFTTGGGGDSDICYQIHVVTWQRRLWLFLIRTLIAFNTQNMASYVSEAFISCYSRINHGFVCCLSAERSWGRSLSDRPAWHIWELLSTTHFGVDVNNTHTHPWLIL